MKPHDPILTQTDVASLAHCSPNTIRRRILAGDGPACVVIGRRRLFRQSDVMAWLAMEAR